MSRIWDSVVDLKDRISLRLFMADPAPPSEEEIAYFAAHPDEIDEVTSPVNIHLLFLVVAVLVGVLMVAGAKLLGLVSHPDYFDGVLKAFVVDLVFEIGVALIGAGVTAYFLGVLLNRQQERTALWRKRIRAAIEAREAGESPFAGPPG